jgi:hypothetical protein
MFQAGKNIDAIVLLRSVVDRRKDTADAYISLAHAYWEGGRVNEAITTLESGLTNGAPDRDIRIRLGIYLAESGTNIPKAITILETLPDTDVEGLNGLVRRRPVKYLRHHDYKKILTLIPPTARAPEPCDITAWTAPAPRPRRLRRQKVGAAGWTRHSPRGHHSGVICALPAPAAH